jgi:uncharacterized protein
MSMPGSPTGNTNGSGIMGNRQLIGAVATIVAVVLLLVVIFVSLFGNADDGEPKQVITIGGATDGGGPAPIDSSASAMSLVAVNGVVISDPTLIELSDDGPLPQIANDGRKPMDVYARPADRGDPRPKIAMIIGGLGLGEAVTQAAIDRLPAGVTLAVTPYGSSLQGLVSTARAKGHEILLEVPLEPFDYPDNDPGQDTLLTGPAAAENPARLRRVMGRVTGYAGIVNSQGARFLSSADDVRFLLDEAARRGLYFVDNGQSDQSQARETAQRAGAAFARADLQVDSNPTREAIERELAALEDLAKRRGSAIGVAAAFPVTIDRVGTWAEGLEEKGLALMPVSALADVGPLASGPPVVSATPQPSHPIPPPPPELPSDPAPAFEAPPHP